MTFRVTVIKLTSESMLQMNLYVVYHMSSGECRRHGLVDNKYYSNASSVKKWMNLHWSQIDRVAYDRCILTLTNWPVVLMTPVKSLRAVFVRHCYHAFNIPFLTTWKFKPGSKPRNGIESTPKLCHSTDFGQNIWDFGSLLGAQPGPIQDFVQRCQLRFHWYPNAMCDLA